jgi:hypothetical protein
MRGPWPARTFRAFAGELTWLAVVLLLFGTARAEPVPGWSFATWSAAPATVKADAEAAKLTAVAVSADAAGMYGLAPSTVPFAFHVSFYGLPATAYPVFRDDALIAVRFVVGAPVTACPAILAGLTADYGPGKPDPSGFANVNWPTNERFALTVVVTPDACWPLFSRPGV